MVLCQQQINYHFRNVEIWRRRAECADLIFACDDWCNTSRTDVKTAVVGSRKQNQSQLSPFERLSVSSDTQNGLQLHQSAELTGISDNTHLHLHLHFTYKYQLRL